MQHVSYPTRNGSTLIDHISSNIPNKIVCDSVIPCDEVSDHDAPFVIFNIAKTKFQKRYKWIRDEKKFIRSSFLEDFSKLPFSIVYSFDDPNEQISILNDLITGCINRHAPLKKIKFTRPPAPWMKSCNVRKLQIKRNELRKKSPHHTKEHNLGKIS